MIDKLNEIKNNAKKCISNITSNIPNFIDNFTIIIDKILAIDFGPFSNDKINISELISNFFLEIELGNIRIKSKNEKNEIIEKEGKKLLIEYLNKNLKLKAENINSIIDHLLKNGLNSILIDRINNKINYAQKKFEKIKQLYEPTLKMINNYFNTFKKNTSDFINECNNKINNKIDDCFDYFIKFINSIFQNKNLYEFYYMIEENILINNDFKNALLDEIKLLKDNLILKYSNELEEKIKELYDKMVKNMKLKEIKEKSTIKINGFVCETENKIFGKINEFLIDKDGNERNKKDIIKENENNIKEKGDTNKKDEINNYINGKNKNDTDNNKEEKESEFDKFDKNIGKLIDKKICEKASELEQRLIKFSKNLDEQAKDYLKLKFSKEIDKKKFDDFFKSIEGLKEKKQKFFASEKLKNNFKKIDNALVKISESKKSEKIINFIDGIDLKVAHEVLNEIEKISPILEPRNKEEFRDNLKNYIIEEINLCYEKFLEPRIKELVIDLGGKIIDAIDKKIAKKK